MSDTDTDFLSIAANPYYAISFAPHVFIKHKKLGPAEDWVIVNASVIKDIGVKTLVRRIARLFITSNERF
jgi:hypothetical protein